MGASSMVLTKALQAFSSLPHLLQSLAMCPGPLQNMQSLLSKRRCRSSAVSLPSLPSLPCSSGFRAAGVALFSWEAAGRDPEAEAERSELSDFFSCDLEEEEFLFCWLEFGFEGVDGFFVVGVSREISERRSQYLASMDWASFRSSDRWAGFPTQAISSLMRAGSPQ